MASKSVFLIGPGFIGWNVLDLLVAEDYSVTTLVRRKEHGEQIEKCGAKVVYGGLDDDEIVQKGVVEHQITIHTATADHLPSVESVLAGIRTRVKQGKKDTVFIHTSGTSILDDNSHGAHLNSQTYSDDNPASIHAIPVSAPHRDVDTTIVAAANEIGEAAKIVIMIPPEIYGFNPAHKRLTIQFPTIARFALRLGYVGHVGEGKSRESQIHVMDLARAYLVLLNHLLSSPPSTFLSNSFFFCENGHEFSWREVAEEIGKVLHSAGRLADPTPREFKKEDWPWLFGDITPAIIGLNSRSRAVRLRQLGWEAREKGIWESFREDELPQILAEWDEDVKGSGGKEGFRGYFGEGK